MDMICLITWRLRKSSTQYRSLLFKCIWCILTTRSTPRYQPRFTNAVTGAFFEVLLKEISKLNNPVEKPYKALFYSAHDTTILGYLDALNLTSPECRIEAFLNQNVSNPACIYTHPGYASNLIFETYEEFNGSLSVMLRFNGTYAPICGKDKCLMNEF
jgi:hypothetical protein